MKRSVGRGAIVLVISGVVCKIFGALFKLPLTNVLGLEGIASFQMIMSLYSLALTFLSGGVTNSLSKLVSSARARGEVGLERGYLKLGVKYVLYVGLTLGCVFALFSNSLAKTQGLGGGESYLLMLLLLPLGGLIGVYRGIIQGHENMFPTALSQIIEQISRFAFGLTFAYFFGRYGSDAGVFGAFLGITLSEILACVYLKFSLSKGVKRGGGEIFAKREFFSALLPLSFSNAVSPFAHAIESLIILPLLSLGGIDRALGQKLYGLQTGMIGTVMSFPLLISLSISVSLLPKISFLSTRGDNHAQREMIERSFSVMWLCLVPLLLGICGISKDFYLLAFPSVIKDYIPLAQGLTYVTAFATLVAGITQFLLSLLQGKGLFSHALVFSLLGGVGKIVSLLLLARMKNVGIYALPISNGIMNLIISICALIKLYSLVKINFFNILLPLAGGFVMFLTVKILISSISGLAGIILCVFVGGGVYIVLTLPLWTEIIKPLLSKFKKDKKRLEN